MACHVVVVDDDESIRESVATVLEDEGYVVLQAADGAEALTILRTSAQPLVVVLDFLMPRVNGFGVLAAATKDAHLATHAYVLLTAYAQSLPDAINGMLKQLAVPVLDKPFKLDVLLAAIHDACVRAQVR